MASEAEENSFVPQWKKELLQRRRALGRAITSPVAGGNANNPGVGLFNSERVGHGSSIHRDTDSGLQSSKDFHPDFSVRTMRLLDSNLGELIVSGNSGIKCNKSDKKLKMVEEKPAKKPSFRGIDKHKEDKNFKFGKRNGKEEEYQSDSSEELQYGPGIVNKLKSKYLSMTLRDTQKYSSRPSLSNLRRATSLENMLEDEKSVQKPHFVKKSYHPANNKSSKISQHHAKYLGLTRGSESMKRARSMDTLLKNDSKNELTNKTNGIILSSIINEDLIIVDTTHDEGKPNKEDKELPPPDVVKQTLKIFEPVKSSVLEIKMNKPPVSPKSSPNKMKPMLSPKPILSPEKRITRPKILSPKRVFPVVTKEVPKSSVVKDKPLSPKSPVEKSTLITPLKFTPLPYKPPAVPLKTPAILEKFEKREKIPPIIKEEEHVKKIEKIQIKEISKVEESKTYKVDKSPTRTPPISPKDEEPKCVKFEKSPDKEIKAVLLSPQDEEPKYVSQKAMESIGKEGTSITFSFTESIPNKSYLPQKNLTQATNTALISQNLDSPTKQIAVIRPVVTNKPLNLTEQEIEKNLINTVKSVETVKIIGPKNEIDSKINSEKSQLWDKKPWQNQNTMVFNFSARQSVPDYIENDGLNLSSNRISSKLNGGRDEADGSGDEDWEPSTVCNIRFIGDNILINGKSNLRKEPKENKKKIQFNDEATVTFEYPPEECLKEDIPPPPPPPPNAPNSTNMPMGGPNLSSYTPSKTVGQNSFELGVTRVTPAMASPPPPPPTQQDKEDYLKPVDTNQETTWSQETTADILF